MNLNPQQVKNIVEAALLTAGGPLPMVRIQALFAETPEPPDADQLKAIINELDQDYCDRGIEVKQVSSGFRIQARQDMGQWLNRLNEDKPARYSRALLETLALIAYRQPITRAGVEDIRGVSVSSSIIKTLLERDWVKVVGHRDVPGRPALYGTTRLFLDYFNLKSLSELPELAELRDIEDIQKEFDLNYAADSASTGSGTESGPEQIAVEDADGEQHAARHADQDDLTEATSLETTTKNNDDTEIVMSNEDEKQKLASLAAINSENDETEPALTTDPVDSMPAKTIDLVEDSTEELNQVTASTTNSALADSDQGDAEEGIDEERSLAATTA